ncbi:MAG: hypothetical protein ACTSX7_11920 [Alphaproteobacteria bacterium]
MSLLDRAAGEARGVVIEASKTKTKTKSALPGALQRITGRRLAQQLMANGQLVTPQCL